jgi:hypothetical protein
MTALGGLEPEVTMTIPVIDFRRRRMTLEWHAQNGTWTDNDNPPALVHGVGFIRAAGPNICLYAHAGSLWLQIATNQYTLSAPALLVRCSRSMASLGLRQHFSVASAGAGVLFSHSYWTQHKDDFFLWLATQIKDPGWHRRTAERWTVGLTPAALRAEVNPPIPEA